MSVKAVCALAAVLVFAACGNQEGPDATSRGTLPTGRVPVGPVPGPGTREQQQVSNPYADDAAATTAGRRLFVQFNCYGCHGGHAGGGMGPSLRDPDWIYGNADSQIFDSIASGRANGMPAFRS